MEQISGSIIIEVTRKCNMQCEHCLRGPAQKLNMNPEHVYKFLSQYSYVDTITFTGGEPSLEVRSIRKILDIAHILRLPVGNFYCVTNGKRNRKALAEVLTEWYYYCDSNEISGLEVSGDQYHQAQDGYPYTRYIEEFEELPFSFSKRGNIPKVIKQGRALEWGSRELTIDTPEIEYWDDQYYMQSYAYLNCKGNVVADCDLSYRSQDKKENIIGNVMDESFSLHNWAKKIYQETHIEEMAA